MSLSAFSGSVRRQLLSLAIEEVRLRFSEGRDGKALPRRQSRLKPRLARIAPEGTTHRDRYARPAWAILNRGSTVVEQERARVATPAARASPHSDIRMRSKDLAQPCFPSHIVVVAATQLR